ncbi:hypothetical protein OK016_16245 [Vibrio chagasii]|nr:hypothetical protein [Vibrio chagasii]
MLLLKMLKLVETTIAGGATGQTFDPASIQISAVSTTEVKPQYRMQPVGEETLMRHSMCASKTALFSRF